MYTYTCMYMYTYMYVYVHVHVCTSQCQTWCAVESAVSVPAHRSGEGGRSLGCAGSPVPGSPPHSTSLECSAHQPTIGGQEEEGGECTRIHTECVYMYVVMALHYMCMVTNVRTVLTKKSRSALLTVWKQICLRDDCTSIHYTKKPQNLESVLLYNVHCTCTCIYTYLWPHHHVYVHVYQTTYYIHVYMYMYASFPIFARGSGGALGVQLTMPVSREVASLRDLFSRASSTNPPPVASMVERLAFSLVGVMADDEDEVEGEGEEGGSALVVSDGSN